ncbi:peroxin 11C [Apiospora rasikravindrae]|uniref:Peroxin 11C n=1 Tax=Apiospora rasikravindrae TaxID=990691 RepID=A0ABR1SMP7_9PEZI
MSSAEVDVDFGTEVEAGVEAGVEHGIEAGVETGTEAGVEAGAETGTEAGAESKGEAGVEATSDLPSGEPVPSVSSGPAPEPRPMPIKAVLAATPSNIDAFLAHLQRCLSTPSGIDTTALFLCYSSRLSAAVLESLTGPAVQRSASQLIALASALPPYTSLLFTANPLRSFSPSAALLLNIAKRLRAFGGMLSEARTFLRLWGAVEHAKDEKAAGGNAKLDKLEVSFSVTQLVACIIFQSLENGAYLAQKGVLSWQPANIGKAMRVSARFWGCFVGLKIGELFYSAYRRSQRTPAERLGDRTVAVMEQEESAWTDEWRKTVVRQLAWFPLTVHWSLEQGLFSDMTVGAIASIPGVVQMRDLWAKTA